VDEQIESWDALRSAYQVARLGTLSAAAAHLGMHHATLIRHIDALEARLGCKLFVRHPRGYVPTAEGRDLLAVAAETEDRFARLAGRLRGQSGVVEGDLVVTTLSGLSEWLTPVLVDFQAAHPGIRLTLVMDERLLRLEYGEAHLALRAGPRPEAPDNVVRQLRLLRLGLYAAPSYVAKHGRLNGLDDAGRHRFVGALGPLMQAPPHAWLARTVPAARIVWRTSDMRAYDDAMIAGAGIGFYPPAMAARRGFIEMEPPRAEWQSDLWLVSHVDVARSAPVRALSRWLREHLPEEPG
jgi:DNA-binding transcriptional LysR family regulator